MVRVRFAPSPTGALHIGGVRTALFNYLFAKKHEGDFLLRIEDTDQTRYVEGAEQYIIEALNWCGIPFDEGVGKEGKHAPYRQSERKEIYKKYADELIQKGKAYYAFDSAEDLDNQRKEYESAGKTFIYNWQTRLQLKNSLSLTEEEVKQRLDRGDEFVIRFKMPEEVLKMNDLIRGEVIIDTKTLDDKVLFKSDGMPTYHLANIVDDHLMEISHVIRGEEWLPSLPLHMLLYRAFGWEAPQFAHLPLILKPVGNGKLSKRDGIKLGFPVFPLDWTEGDAPLKGFKGEGYFPEALVNFLALLGWNPGTDQEIFSLNELIELFDLERVHKAGARFDPEKIKWFNHQYLQKKSDRELADDFSKILIEKGISIATDKVEKIVHLIKERATFVSDFWELGSYFFQKPSVYEDKAMKKQWKENTAQILTEVAQIIKETSNFSSVPLEEAVKNHITEKGYSFGQVMPPLRLALVGEMKGVHIFDIMEVIGKEETLQRIEAIKSING
ncbi:MULTISPECIES: glutamate--tRNA ligase [Capnocytophaga]|uniref:glutamate--tRNA ligase n=1 Tax=Capnocytophaga TaxID=1016 RepID=UPI000BB171C3|nr:MULTISPECIES: glutamate--tRNA ligase [Capnocytophaga]ATA72468.1 glutamate--tRNA ligase [Capnocytophaga sp. H4358]GIM59954.1 glutamate--tRNA ligase [Capnocytophaga canis]